MKTEQKKHRLPKKKSTTKTSWQVLFCSFVFVCVRKNKKLGKQEKNIYIFGLNNYAPLNQRAAGIGDGDGVGVGFGF